jgi:hypothetical protein
MHKFVINSHRDKNWIHLLPTSSTEGCRTVRASLECLSRLWRWLCPWLRPSERAARSENSSSSLTENWFKGKFLGPIRKHMTDVDFLVSAVQQSVTKDSWCSQSEELWCVASQSPPWATTPKPSAGGEWDALIPSSWVEVTDSAFSKPLVVLR